MYFLFRFGWHSFQLNVVNYKQGLGGGEGEGWWWSVAVYLKGKIHYA